MAPKNGGYDDKNVYILYKSLEYSTKSTSNLFIENIDISDAI